MTRAAAARHRRPARRPVHRAADQDRAGRPAAGDVRPQRRGAGADRRRRSPPATASTPRWRRPGSRSPTARRSSCSPTATSPTAPSRGGSPTSTTCPTSTRASPPRPNHAPATTAPRASGPTCATRRPWPARGRSPARPGSSTASAASRRGTATATSPTTRPTTTCMVRTRQAKVDGSPTSLPPLEVDDPAGDGQGAGARLGLDVRPDRRRRTPGAQGRLPASRRRTCATSTRSRKTSARSSRATTRCSCPR